MANSIGVRRALLLGVAATIGVTATPVAGQVMTRADAMRNAPVFASDPGIQEALQRIAARSASWRSALDSVAALGRMVLVVTPAEVVVADDPAAAITDAFDSTSLAAAAPVVSTDGAVNVVLAVINLPLLRNAHGGRGAEAEGYAADLERLLIHEVYSHAVPYLLEGNVTGRCADPAEGEPAATACSIQRENRIRAELGLGERTDYGLAGLSLSQARRQR